MQKMLFLSLTVLLQLLCLQQSMVTVQAATASPTDPMMTTAAVPMTTTPNIGGFTSDQLGVLIGIPVALVVIILIGIVIGCAVQHKVQQEDKLLEGKPYRDSGEVGPGGQPQGSSMGRSQMYYTDYLGSQTKM